MLLERRVVKILNDYNIRRNPLSRSEFVDCILNRKWPRVNYFFYDHNKLKRKIEIAVDDCIEDKFIADDANIKVTKKGRDYIKKLGLMEEFLKRRKRTIVNPTSFILGVLTTTIIGLITYFLNK